MTRVVIGGLVLPDPDRLDGGIIRDGAVAFSDGVIRAVSTAAQIRAEFPDAHVTGSPHHVVIPGLVNAHDHGSGLGPWRLGHQDDDLESWLVGLWGLPEVDPMLSTLWGDLAQLRAGVTTVVHALPPGPAGFLPSALAALEAHAASGIRSVLGLPVADQHTFVYGPDAEFLQRLPPPLGAVFGQVASAPRPTTTELMDQVSRFVVEHADAERTRFVLHPTGAQWCSADLIGAVASTARTLAIGVHLHCAESRHQADHAKKVMGGSIVRYLEGLGLGGPRLTLAHGVWLSDEDRARCVTSGTVLVHNPSSNLRLGAGTMPVATMLREGITVGLGLDSCALGDAADLFGEMRLAGALSNVGSGVQRRLSAEEVLQMATTGGARAAGLDGEVGRLLPGYRADLVSLDLRAMSHPYVSERVPLAELLVRLGDPRHVRDVFVNGEPVISDGSAVHHDEDGLAARLRQAAHDAARGVDVGWRDQLVSLAEHVRDYYT